MNIKFFQLILLQINCHPFVLPSWLEYIPSIQQNHHHQQDHCSASEMRDKTRQELKSKEESKKLFPWQYISLSYLSAIHFLHSTFFLNWMKLISFFLTFEMKISGSERKVVKKFPFLSRSPAFFHHFSYFFYKNFTQRSKENEEKSWKWK
jgi:hypothetical protein